MPFTGGTDTGIAINRALAARDGPIAKLIAETGGLNAMIVDSSALPEQVVDDALASAFDSAGQRCSALRVLFLQDDVAEATLDMLIGAARELKIGDPFDYASDVGPVIDEEARAALEAHKARMRKEGRELLDLPLGDGHAAGTYVAPAIYRDPVDLGAHPRSVRTHPARGPLLRRPLGRGLRRHQCHRLWSHARSA